MNKRTLIFTLILAISINANENSQMQLEALSNQIVIQDQKVSEMLQRLIEHIGTLKDDKKKIDANLEDAEFNSFYRNEVERFAREFLDPAKNKDEVLFNDSIFGQDTALLKFYILMYCHESYALEKLLHKWARIINENDQWKD